MAGSESTLTVLLMLEAIDKASQTLEKITKKLEGLGHTAQDAAETTALTGEELQAAQVKAEAASAAYDDAVTRQVAAQERLAEVTRTARDAQARQVEADQAQTAAMQELADTFDGVSQEVIDRYMAMSDAAATNATAAEESAVKITDLQAQIATATGGAADEVQAALDREMETYVRLAEAAKASADEVATALGDQDAKVIAAYQEQNAAAQEAAAAMRTATSEQIAALDELGAADKLAARRAQELAAAQKDATVTVQESASSWGGVKSAALATSAVVAGIGYESVKAAARFQSATTVLQTSGGETAGQIAQWSHGMLTYNGTITQVRAGILNLAGSTGTTTQELTNGMYMIGSAGYTGAAGLNVLQSAAQGAKAENASLSTVSNALTTVMTNYGVSVASAARSTQASNAIMNQMIAVVQNGKTTTEALAGSLSSVLPIAANAGLSFAQVGGAMATMTAQGMSADQSAQDLANTIRSLQNPTAVATTEMQQMGLNSNQVAMQLGKKGLTGTLAELTSAITAHMGPASQVIMSTFQNATQAAADARQEIAAMPAGLRTLAHSFLNGTISYKQWRLGLQALGPTQRNLMMEFAKTAEKAHSFNTLLTTGAPAAQTYEAALAKMTGGATGVRTALMLTGSHLATFDSNAQKVAVAGQNAGSSVKGWSILQGTLNQKLAEARQSVDAAAISLGTALLPMVTKLVSMLLAVVRPVVSFITHNKTLAAIVLVVAGALGGLGLAFVAAAKVVEVARGAMETFGLISKATAAQAALAGDATEVAGGEMAAAGTAADVAWGPWLIAIVAVAAAAYLIIDHWGTVKRWLGDLWNWIKSAFGDVVSFVKGHVHEVAAAVTVILGPIGLLIAAALEIATHWRAVQHVVAAVWDWMKSAASHVAGFVSGVWDKATREISKYWDLEIKGLKIIWADLTTAWNDTGGKLVTAIRHAFDSVSAAFDREWTKVSADLSSIWRSLVTIWDATGGKMLSAIERGVADTVGFVARHWAVIVEIFRALFAPLVALVKGSWALISGIFHTTWTALTAVVRMGITAVEMTIKAGLSIIEEAFTLAWGLIVTTARAVWDVLSGAFSAAMAVVTGIFKAGWDVVVGIFKAVWAAITTTVNVALDLLTGIFKGFADLVTGQWGKLWNDVTSTVTSVWDDIAGFFTSILGDITTTVQGATSALWSGFIGGIESALSGIESALHAVWSGIVNFFSSAGTWLESVGQDIVRGLIHGVEDMIGQALSAVESMGSGLIHTAKSVLAIFSPSAEFHAIGALTVLGFVQGILASAPLLTAAMRKATGAITGPGLTATFTAAARTSGAALVSSAASGLGAASRQSAGGAGPAVYVTVEGGNHLMCDGDMDKFARQLGKRIATQILPAGGVHVAMAGRG